MMSGSSQVLPSLNLPGFVIETNRADYGTGVQSKSNAWGLGDAADCPERQAVHVSIAQGRNSAPL